MAALIPDPTATLADKIREAESAYQAADQDRRRVFAIAYDSGAMTYQQIGDAAGLTHSVVRALIADVSDSGARRKRAADHALSLLDEGSG